eukprot:6182355-Pleurochrysis_carterae.AAC.1
MSMYNCASSMSHSDGCAHADSVHLRPARVRVHMNRSAAERPACSCVCCACFRFVGLKFLVGVVFILVVLQCRGCIRDRLLSALVYLSHRRVHSRVHAFVHQCARASVRSRVRACMRACVRACMRACVRACVRAC